MIFKKFRAVEFGSQEYQKFLKKEALPYGGSLNPINRTLEALSEAPLSCKTVIFEWGYVDKDYQDEFSAYYSKSFKDYTQRCTRLHFFSALLPKQQRQRIDLYPTKSYLGFIVLRPTDLQRMGRTILRPPIKNSDCEFITCATWFWPHLLGNTFPVKAMPFIQQDTQVGACAQASLWMLARYMSYKFYYREHLPAEINQLAKSHTGWGRHFPAEKGLNVIQMLDALQGMGLSAISYDKELLDGYGENQKTGESFERQFWSSWKGEKIGSKARRNLIRTAKLADIAYRYIESGLPVIFMTPDHALVGIGHKYDCKKKAKLAIQRIPSFFVNNDAAGPYLEMPIFSKSRNGDRSFLEVHGIIAVTPHEATLCGEDAEDVAKDAVKRILEAEIGGKPFKDYIVAIREEFSSLLKDLEFRTYLTSSVDFQRDLILDMKAGNLNKQVGNKLLQIDYPKFLWITEVSSSALLKSEDKHQRKCLGRIVIDSTAPKVTRGVIAMHFADVLTIYDRQGKQTLFRKIFDDSTPFLHRLTAKEDDEYLVTMAIRKKMTAALEEISKQKPTIDKAASTFYRCRQIAEESLRLVNG